MKKCIFSIGVVLAGVILVILGFKCVGWLYCDRPLAAIVVSLTLSDIGALGIMAVAIIWIVERWIIGEEEGGG